MRGENLSHACVYPLQLSSGVNSLALLFFFCFKARSTCLSDCCFLGNGNWKKETQKEQRRRTANYEQEGWGGVEESGGGGGERFLIRPPCAPLNPVLPPLLLLHPLRPLLFVSVFCCDLFVAPCSFIFEAVTMLLRALASGSLPQSEITPGRCCRWGLGWRALSMFWFTPAAHEYFAIWFMCFLRGGQIWDLLWAFNSWSAACCCH